MSWMAWQGTQMSSKSDYRRHAMSYHGEDVGLEWERDMVEMVSSLVEAASTGKVDQEFLSAWSRSEAFQSNHQSGAELGSPASIPLQRPEAYENLHSSFP